MLKGSHHSKKTKKILSQKSLGNKNCLGKHLSAVTKEKLSKINKGKKLSKTTCEKMSKAQLGHKTSEETRRKIGDANKISLKGRHLSLKTRKKLSKAISGKKHYNWKGGISSKHTKIRRSFKYNQWRKQVFIRDKFTCVWCGDKNNHNLEADHIQLFSTHPDLRFAIDNGRTLCKKCHIIRHKN